MHVDRLSRRHSHAFFASALAVALAVGLLAARHAPWIERLDHGLFDALLRGTASDATAGRTIVVEIDDVSLSSVGQWPWPRYRIATLLRQIAAHRPAAIGLDILFAEPDRASLTNIRDTFKRDFDVDVAWTGVPEGLTDNDGFLGLTMATHGVVAGHYLYFDHATRNDTGDVTGIAIAGHTDALSADRATGLLANAPAIGAQTRTSGFVNKRVDDDGLLRRLPLVIEYAGRLHPSLALATTMRALGVANATVESDPDGPRLRVGTHRIPIDESGNALLHFAGDARRYPSISAVDVLAGQATDADFAGKVVIVGTSAVGLNDRHATALDPRFPGAKAHAVVAESILADDALRTPAWHGSAAFVASLAAGLAMAWLFTRAGGVLVVLAGSVALAGTALAASAGAFVADDAFVSPAAPLVVIGMLFVLFALARLAIEKRRAWAWAKKLENARQVTIESMASVAETRDPETGAHIKRTQHYVKALAEELKRSGAHVATLTTAYIDLLFLSAPLHDIGKVGVPDHILLKPGRLTPDEFEIMKKHAIFGRDIIASSSQRIEGENFLRIAAEIAATHHEKWDGTGYPHGLAGEDIPLAGCIMAVADVYDALISRRCYKEPFTHQLATTLMSEARGTMFDPAVLDAFFAIEAKIRSIAGLYRDEAERVVEAAPIPAAPIETYLGA